MNDLLSVQFMPHGYCFLWSPEILWLHTGSDALIALAYFIISGVLVYLVWRRPAELEKANFELALEIDNHQRTQQALHEAHDKLEHRVIERTRELQQVNLMLQQEIAQRRRAEQALLENTRHLQLITDSVPVLIAYIDDHLCYQFNNAAYERLFGISCEQLKGRHLSTIAGIKGASKAGPFIDKVLAGTPVTYENEFVQSNGKRMICDVKLVPDVKADGSIPGFYVVGNDITDRKQAEQKLAETAVELKSFAYSIAHDLKAPLRAMRGFSEALIDDYYNSELDDSAQLYLNQIHLAAIRMGQLIDDLLTYSQIGRESLTFLPVDLNRLVKDVQKNLLVMIETSQATIHISGKLPTVKGHWTTLEMTLQNLLSNAIRFVAPGVIPEITLSARTDNEFCSLLITDNGIGIDKRYQKRIFNIFQRLHTREEYPGTGIGLAIVKKTMKLHDGHVTVESVIGQGSTFAIYFPLERLVRYRRIGFCPRPVGLEFQNLHAGRQIRIE